MGASNVAAVFIYWRRLPHAPFRLLVYMALVSMDADDPPKYWGGWQALAEALGRKMPATHADRVAVTTALTTLRQEGAISRAVNPARGRRAEYLLHLMAPPTRQAEPAQRDRLSLPTRQAEPANVTGSDSPQGVVGTTKEHREEPQETESLTHQRARENGGAKCIGCKWLPEFGHAPGCAEGQPA
jgi:hypothetical protein